MPWPWVANPRFSQELTTTVISTPMKASEGKKQKLLQCSDPITVEMFRKPFKLKFQIQLKSTEKKKFSADLKAFFPALRDEDIASLVGSKESVIRIKVTTFKEEDVEIYCINKIPMYIDIVDSDIKLPTIFMVWRFPHMLPSFTVNGSVLTKLKNGADLFFPGIYMEGLFFGDLEYKKKDPVYVNLVDNRAAMAVGLTLVDKDDVMDGNKRKEIGKIMKVYHTAGDFLFKMHTDAVVLQLGPPDWALPINEDTSPAEDPPETENEAKIVPNSNDVPTVNGLTDGLNSLQMVNSKEIPETNGGELEEDKNNELLEYCFLKALKTTPKDSYPILPATFYAKHILTNLPEGQNLNLRKTKWKKFSNFLQEMALEGLIQLQKTPKNDFTISSANTSHVLVKEFADPHSAVSVVEPKADNKLVVQQVYSVTAVTLPLFAKFGLKKSDELTRNDVRNHLNDYIKSEGLVHPENPEMVMLDPILYGILKGDAMVSRANLLSGIFDRMSVQHKVSNCANALAITHKGKMPLIEFEICLRTGNKKVTLINNLECYGVGVSNFSKELQHKAAASTSITPVVPGKKGPQVQVQGNQIAVAVGILKEKYNINDKFMKGLEKAVKSKNKK